MIMNRRTVLKSFTAAVVVAVRWLIGASPSNGRRYGPVTLTRHRALRQQGVDLRIYHRGRDITRECFFADDTGDGVAHIFLRNTEGRHYLRPLPNGEREVAKDIVYGVTFQEVVT